MLRQTKLWLRMPIIVTVTATVAFATVIVLAWLFFLRPALHVGVMANETSISRSLPTKHAQIQRPTIMSLIVLSWSSDLKQKLEKYVDTLEPHANGFAIVATKYGIPVTRQLKEVGSYLDSLSKLGEVDTDTIPMASLPSVLRNGLATAKGSIVTPYHIVVLGDFPRAPTLKELRSSSRTHLVLADEDYQWLARTSGHHVVFICSKKPDRVRQAFQQALDDSKISHETIQ